MNLVADACSLINLFNAGALAVVATIPGTTIWVSPLVVDECNAACAAKIFELEQAGHIHLVSAQELDSERFLGLVDTHRLGDGETECILVADTFAYTVCTDDGKARKVSVELLGEDKVVGSARLLQWLVPAGLADCLTANAYFDEMKSAGGRLPDLQHEFFCNECGH